MAYFQMFVRDAEQHWCAEFGDRDQECVKFERDQYRSQYKVKDLKIVKFARVPTVKQLQAKQAELNQGATNV